eukprot:TRINITY_DN18853_c0_g1_i3.p1 TRINITY_DN18853_c0_g1~~TRINITY_DN18853_c0_g1_i3.p1  ORF type:complete len:304 (-),score=21.33 TRINITY_DN18853_c0_g1_i3:206-1018(-)
MNGVGAVVLKTVDGGNSYKRCNHSGYALMYLSIAFDSLTTGVVTGIGLGTNFPGIEETTDGENFFWSVKKDERSRNFFLNAQEFIDTSQNVEAVQPASGSIVAPGFGIAGDFNQFNGASVTLDQGTTWKNFDIGVDYWSRYGSYPSPTTWYISAGWWPGYDFHYPEESGIHVLSQKIRLNHGTGVEYLHNAKKTQTSRRLLQMVVKPGLKSMKISEIFTPTLLTVLPLMNVGLLVRVNPTVLNLVFVFFTLVMEEVLGKYRCTIVHRLIV